MIPKIGAGLAILAVCGCTTARPIQVVLPHKVSGDPRLPANDIAKICPPAQWSLLNGLKYRAFGLIDAHIRPDGSLEIARFNESYPDTSWNRLALVFAREAQLHATTTGSNIPPDGEAAVIFFRQGIDGNMVLIFGRQKEEPLPGRTQKAEYFRLVRC